jgi:PAS domain-containing protein
VVVIDWGLAKEVGGVEADLSHGASVEARPSADPTATLAGHILGTPAYMAPEQAAGHLERIGPPTDVYGLSAILYEILTGQPPFVGDTTLDVLRQVEYQEPARPSTIVAGVPEGLEQICLKGLAKEPAERHPSADSLARAVQSWVSELAERRQSEEERERFFALSLDLLAIIDDGGRLRQVGPAWSRLLGYEREQLAGRLLLRYPVPSRLRIARSQRPGAMALRADICETRSEFLAPSRGLLDEDVFTEGRLGLKCLRCRSFDQPYGVGIGQLGQDRSSIRAAEFD